MYIVCRLKRNFKEGPKSGPSMVRVRFAEVHQMILEAFPGNNTSSVEVARLLVATFPGCEAKRDTKGKREMFYIGIERVPAESAGTSGSSSQAILSLPLDVQLMAERRKVQMLTAKVSELEQQLHSVQQPVTSTSSSEYARTTIKNEFSLLLSEGSKLCCGPDTLDHLTSFSLAGLIHEVRQLAPNLYSLLCDLGDTRRNARDETTTEEIKALTSLCVLANARSQRAKGVQLFISIMLIARAVNKQVCK